MSTIAIFVDVMVKFFLSLFIALFIALPVKSAREGVSDEFRKLESVASKDILQRAYGYVEKCKYDSALIYYSVVANRYYDNPSDKKGIKHYINALQNIGIIYMVNDYDYKKSYDYLLQAKELAESSGEIKELPNIYNCIANILQTSRSEEDVQEGEQVLEILYKSFYTSVQLNKAESASLALTNIIAQSIGRDKRKSLKKIFSLYRKMNAPYSSNRQYALLHCKGYEQLLAKNYGAAIECFRQSLKKVDNGPLSYRAVLLSYNNISDIYIFAGQYDKALETVNFSIDFARRNNSEDYIPGLYHTLMGIYKEKRDTVNMQKYEYLYLKEKDKILSDTKLSSVKNVKFIRELNRANEQVRELSHKRKVHMYLLSAAIVVVCIIAFLLFRLYRAYGKLRQANKHLYKTNVELLAREAAAREKRKERTRIEAEVTVEQSDASGNTEGSQEQKAKYQGSRMSENDTQELYQTILHIMETSAEIYHIGFNIEKLSELVHSRPRYVSQTINQEYGDNFNQFLNEYRIKEACRRLNGKDGYSNMTIEAIAESVGFKSRTSFGALFKSSTGLSPSAYQRMAKESTKSVL